MSDNILIDTSVWIAYFQANTPVRLSEQVDELLSQSKVHVPKIVLAELIQGAHSEKDLAVVRDFLEAFSIIGEQVDTWLKAGKLSYALKKKGKTVNLADCYISILAEENDCAILTLDKHFREIQKEAGIRLIPVHS
jgi:predicted nucleic acid-binding protein